jgi:aromatic-L-amino-acid decarboxylase
VTAEGTCFPTGTIWKGHAAMRLSVCNFRTDAVDISRSVAAIARAAQEPR